MGYVNQVAHKFLRIIEQWGGQEWLLVLLVVILLGLVCLRGFGSRSRY
jgi:hypothetical protein